MKEKTIENCNETKGWKVKMEVVIILLVYFLCILAGVIVCQFLLSRAEEDVYFTCYNYDEKLSTLYCYDALKNRTESVVEVDGNVKKGIVDDENKKFLYWTRISENNIKLEMYDMENKQTEVLFSKGDMIKEIGMQLENVVFNKTIKSYMYLICSTESENEKYYFLVKYIPDTGEMNVWKELVTKEAWIARDEMVYYFNDTIMREHNNYQSAGPLCGYNSVTNEEINIMQTAGWDISVDGNRLIMCEKEDNCEKYYIYDLNTGEKRNMVSLSGIPYHFFSFKQMRFIGDSNDCVYVKTVRTIFDSYSDSSIWIKEPGHLPRRVFPFGISCGEVTLLY